MSPVSQLVVAAVTAGLPTLTVLISLLINNQRLNDLARSIYQRFTDVDRRFTDLDRRFTERIDYLRGDMLRMEQAMDARLKHLEEHLAR